MLQNIEYMKQNWYRYLKLPFTAHKPQFSKTNYLCYESGIGYLIKKKELLLNLNNISIKNPKENSNPAIPKIKKVIETKLISSLILPNNIAKQYKTNHIISEKSNKEIKFIWLNKNPTITNQKIKFQ